MCCGKVSIWVTFLSLRRGSSTFREMITGATEKVSFQDYEMLSSKIRVSKGDVIFARYATIGTVCFVDTEDNILVSYACLIIKPNSSLLYGEFLFYYLKSTAFLEEIKQYIKANTQANVGLDSVTKAKIALPSVQEQQEIVDYLRDSSAIY